MRVAALTTIDNPYDPFTQFDDWDSYDRLMGYNTAAYLGRIAKSSPELSPADQNTANTMAVDEIVRINPLGIYKKVERDFGSSA